MTRQPGTDWDDDRLDAAFAARAAFTPATPSDLTNAVQAGVARSARLGLLWPRLAAVAAVGVLAVLIGGSSILAQLGADPDPSAGPATGGAETVQPLSPVLAALGSAMTVSEALDVRDRENSDREIVVEAFLSSTPGPCVLVAYTRGNPTLLHPCDLLLWLAERPETTILNANSAPQHVPVGPAFHPSFALVNDPRTPHSPEAPDTSAANPVRVVVVGHFHDRRAALCPEEQRADCAKVFVVDQVVSIDGVEQAVPTQRLVDAAPRDLVEDVDALVAAALPGAIVLSRQVVTLDPLVGIEPILADDMLIPHIADRSKLAWVVTALDPNGEPPAARTFVLLDGSNWFAEVTATGAITIERTAPRPTGSAQPVLPPGDPSAFDDAPTSILGIPVTDIASVQQARQGAMDQLGRDEFAIRAWYIGPDPRASCEELPAVHAPTPPCDEARHWLLDDPQQYGVEPGQRRQNPAEDQYTPVLNPLVPVDVPFKPGSTWVGDVPSPRPVIVLGHFGDNRSDSYAGDTYFVVDALAWAGDQPVAPLGPVTVFRMTPEAMEDVTDVLARIDAVSTHEAVATWVTVATPTDFAAMDRRAADMTELASGPPVWMVRRLIHSEMDGRERLAVQWVWTADGGSRIWWTECPDCSPDLATTLDVRDLDANTTLVRVLDYDEAVTAVTPATGLRGLSWQRVDGNPRFMEIARGRSPREVVIRWTGSCHPVWQLSIHVHDGSITLELYPEQDCEGEAVTRRLVIEFEEPVDINRFNSGFCCG